MLKAKRGRGRGLALALSIVTISSALSRSWAFGQTFGLCKSLLPPRLLQTLNARSQKGATSCWGVKERHAHTPWFSSPILGGNPRIRGGCSSAATAPPASAALSMSCLPGCDAADEWLKQRGVEYKLIQQSQATGKCRDSALERGVSLRQIVKSMVYVLQDGTGHHVQCCVPGHLQVGTNSAILLFLVLQSKGELLSAVSRAHPLIEPCFHEKLDFPRSAGKFPPKARQAAASLTMAMIMTTTTPRLLFFACPGRHGQARGRDRLLMHAGSRG